MTEFLDDLRAFVNRSVAMFRRASAGPILIRLGLYASALVALLLAWPADVVAGRAILVFAVAALAPTLYPRGMVVTGMIFAVVSGWLLATTAYQEAVTYWRLILLTTALYLMHALAALSSVLPYDSVVSAGVLGGWLRRTGLVVLLSGALGLFVLAIPGYVGSHRYLIASIAGLVVMGALAVYLATLARRR